MLDVIWLIPAFPLAGFVLILLFGRRLGQPGAGLLATAMVAASFVVSVGAYFDLLSRDEAERAHTEVLFSWVPVSSLHVDMAFLADPLSITMCLFVTGVGALIHLFAIGYMHGDPKFSKFFLYMNLFVLSMVILVLGENLLVTFLGWEGVGTCSYFLIAFWHTRDSAATAGKKAFVTNRIGDWGFMVAMFLAFQALGSVSFSVLNEASEQGTIARTTATAIALLLFVGAVGKSAQLPLYLWLPDAMEGPTPVSALIHAATMVTAGVFLMTRVNPVLEYASDWAPEIIAWVGAITALFAATIAVAQNDIKKVLAYSTVSQLGYMFLAVGYGGLRRGDLPHGDARVLQGADVPRVGVGDPRHARRAGHAPDGSAAQVHAGDRGDVHRRLAGDRRRAAVRRLLVEGRDPAVRPRLQSGAVCDRSVTAVLTAYYMTRQVVMVFFGEAKWESRAAEHGAHGEFKPHESSPVMLFPLVALAGLAIVGGVIQLPSYSWIPEDLTQKLEHWLHPVVEFGEAEIIGTSAYDNRGLLALAAIAASLIGIAAGIAVYSKHKAKAFEPQLLADGYRYDATVSAFMGGPGARPSRRSPGSTRPSSTAPSTGRLVPCGEPPARSARARPETCATTPASSGSAPCCCSLGSCSPGESCSASGVHMSAPRRSRS